MKTYEAEQKRQKLLKQNAKRRDEDRARQGKDNYLMPFFMAGFLLSMLTILDLICLNIDLTEHV